MNRYIVASWGRAGSVALCEYVRSHIRCQFVRSHIRKQNKIVRWQLFDSNDFDPSFNDKENIVGHCHSLTQLQYSYPVSKTFIAIRNPSLAAISLYYAKATGYMHVRSESCLNKLRSQKELNSSEKNILEQAEKFKSPHPTVMNVEDLNLLRDECIKWNNDAFSFLKDDIRIYNNDKDDMIVFIKQCGMMFRDKDISVTKSNNKWDLLTLNTSEISKWISDNAYEDQLLMEKWTCHTS